MMAIEQPRVDPLSIAIANVTKDQQPRPRAKRFSLPLVRTYIAQIPMAYNNRPLSPGGRRIQNPGRVSDNTLPVDTQRADRDRQSSYVSPRSSGGVIPLSSETFLTYQPTSTQPPRPEARYDAYSGRPTEPKPSRQRRASVDAHRPSVSGISTTASRNRPTVVQGSDFARPSSPLKGSQSKDVYLQPGSSKEPRKAEHKKVYSVNNDGTTSLLADVSPAKERHHRRRDSDAGDRSGYQGSDRRRKDGYVTKVKEKSIDDDDAFSYTDAAGMFQETEPSWRMRPRRGSLDRSGAGSRDRSGYNIDAVVDPRRSNRDIGPPPSTRGWDKINDGMGRSTSVRDNPRPVLQSPVRTQMPQSPTRGRHESVAYGDSRDQYYIPPRTTSTERHGYLPSVQQDRPSHRAEHQQYDDRRQPRRPERRNSTTRAPDHSVERRGFGIRSESQDRYGRGSDESFTQQAQYRDVGGFTAPEPYRRDTNASLYDEPRREPERKDRSATDRSQYEDRDRHWERDARERDVRRRDDEPRSYDQEYDYGRDQRRDRDREHDTDRERERERERMAQPQQDRAKYRRDSYRDREHSRQETAPRDLGSAVSPSVAGLAGAAGAAGAAFAAGSYLNRSDDRGRDHGREWEQDRRADKSYDYDRDTRAQDLRAPEHRPHQTQSDEGAHYPTAERDRPQDHDRGLGFAYENPPYEPSKSAPPMKEPAEPASRKHEMVEEQEFERTHEDQPGSGTSHSFVDPDDDYRRRMAQVRHEMGIAPDEKASDSDTDRERRRRERELRQRDRPDLRNGDAAASSVFSDTTASSRMPGSFETDSIDGTASSMSRPSGLTRRPSILDRQMDEPAQIIDNSMSEKRENRVRIVDPPSEEEDKRPKGILKRPTSKFPEHPDAVREGVAPLKDATKKGIPPGARWTKINRQLVNPEALEEAKERYEERQDYVIVLRVITKEEIQKLADRTTRLREERERERRHRADRNHDRRDRDEYEDDDSEDEYKPRAPKLLEGPATGGAEPADFVNSNRERRRERDTDRDSAYMSGGLGRRDEYSDR